MTSFLERMYTNATIWLVGAGFGGGAASVGTTFYYRTGQKTHGGTRPVRALTFNAPGDFWYLKRAGLYDLTSTEAPTDLPIWNVGSVESPLFQSFSSRLGQSGDSAISFLAHGTFPLQTVCRSGQTCLLEDITTNPAAHNLMPMLPNARGDPKLAGGSRLANSRHTLKAALNRLPSKARGIEVPCHRPLRCHECPQWRMSSEPMPRDVLLVPADMP